MKPKFQPWDLVRIACLEPSVYHLLVGWEGHVLEVLDDILANGVAYHVWFPDYGPSGVWMREIDMVLIEDGELIRLTRGVT